MGVYGAPGNHEYYSGYGSWIPFFEKNGIRMLQNQSVKLPNGVYLAGITDRTAKRLKREYPDPEKAAKGIKKTDCSILLSHNPEEAYRAYHFFDLQLSGHTHGGMVWGMDYLVKKMNGNLVSGLYQIGDMKLYLTNGTCIWSGFPIRFGRPSEIALITLSREKQN